MVLRYRKSTQPEALITEQIDSEYEAIDTALMLMRLSKPPVWDVTLDGQSYSVEALDDMIDRIMEYWDGDASWNE
jgi:hypothetical protein